LELIASCFGLPANSSPDAEGEVMPDQMLSEEFLVNRGYLPNGEGNGEFSKNIFGVDWEPEGPHMHLLVCMADQSVFLEAYAPSGATLAVVELGKKTASQLAMLELALGML